ncbi:extracellular sulfatase SULF-1 homolog isoform X2 [Homalodisca vitripennis]|uniref:extracellular sulfatase SULF-1 homolog isoform X2 n=1 Tax=Homalodisca vitripennis TaxID=197043 RepID=UPI001EEB4AAE|nr:extracellular sulfatase SULF-1 homolog isoform X2 [Homalodisca vitripennis]
MAGVEAPPHMDGRSFYRLLFRRKRLRDSVPWPDTFLIESSGRRETAEMAAETKLQESLTNIEKNLTQTLEQVAAAEDPQLDNQVSVVVTGNKLERLALECQRSELQAPCRPGQKWQCIADGNRWRKHKCKLRPTLPRTKARKCACFTPSGVMYTKLENDDFTTHVTRHYARGGKGDDALLLRAGRTARKTSHNNSEQNDVPLSIKTPTSPDSSEEFKREMAQWMESQKEEQFLGLASENLRRIRRHSRITGVLDELLNVRDRILNFEDVDNGTSELNCTVGSVKNISCSDSVYKSPESWRATQQRLELEIRKLRSQLEKLKEIKKFLKDKKPYDRSAENTDEDTESATDETGVEEEDDFFDEIFDEDETTMAPITERSFGKHRRKNKSRFYDFGVNGTILGDVRRNFSESGNDDGERNAKRRKHKLVSENTEVNTLSRHRHRHKSEVDLRTTTTTEPSANLPLPTSQGKKDWPGPGPGRIDVTILEPVLSQTHTRRPVDLFPPDTCYCDPYLSSHKDEKDIAREARRRMKEERLRRKERKLRRKAKLESECLAEKMNCFNHDNQHWRTPPFWTEGSFCFCMNANNNTYSCLRTINKTHNFLYCEFITGLVTFYNLRLDPFEQWNRASLLTPDERSQMHDTLTRLKSCRGVRQCTVTRRGTTTATIPLKTGDREDKEKTS